MNFVCSTWNQNTYVVKKTITIAWPPEAGMASG